MAKTLLKTGVAVLIISMANIQCNFGLCSHPNQDLCSQQYNVEDTDQTDG